MTDDEKLVLQALKEYSIGKATIFRRIFRHIQSPNETESQQREHFYKIIDELVEQKLIDCSPEDYETAIEWKRYSISLQGKRMLEKTIG